MKYSITRALSEITMLDKRINSKIEGATFIGERKLSSEKINNVFTRKEFEENAKNDYKSITDLIQRRNLIKSLIVKSNAETDVTIGNETMKVAEAIERKKTIAYEEKLLAQMVRQYNTILATVTRRNEIMESNLDTQLQAMVGSENKKNEGMESFIKTYREQNGWEVVNPLELYKKIEALKTEIEDFKNNVDFSLSENNAKSQIEIPD